MANPYKEGMSARRSQGGSNSHTDGHSNNNVQRVRNHQVAQSPSRTRSTPEQKSRKTARSPEMFEISQNSPARGGSPSRRPSTTSCRLARTSSISPSRLPPTVTNPEGRGRKLPATPIRYVYDCMAIKYISTIGMNNR